MPEVEIESILTELRERAQKAGSPQSLNQPAGGPSLATITPDLDALSRYDILEAPFTSHRRILGKLIILVKNFARELLVQIFDRQVAYNEANTQVVRTLARTAQHFSHVQQELPRQLAVRGELHERLQSMGLNLERCERSVSELELRIVNEHLAGLRADLLHSHADSIRQVVNEHLAGLRSEIADTAKSIDELKLVTARIPPAVPAQPEVQELKRMVLDQQRRIAILLEESRRTTPADTSKEKPRMIEERDHLLDTFYLMLEDQFRGTRQEIKQRLQTYLPLITDFKSDNAKVLDIGCGRGEFLELLRDHGVAAQGVDYNRSFVEQCRAQDFEVVETEALGFLRDCKSNTYSAVSAIHVVEHLPFRVLIALLDEVLRVLRPGGLAILETPNPENILVGSSNFHIDPTHRKPLPSLLLSFLVEKRGFCDVKVLKLHPCPDDVRLESSPVADRLNEILYGPQDYAVLGYKV